MYTKARDIIIINMTQFTNLTPKITSPFLPPLQFSSIIMMYGHIYFIVDIQDVYIISINYFRIKLSRIIFAATMRDASDTNSFRLFNIDEHRMCTIQARPMKVYPTEIAMISASVNLHCTNQIGDRRA